MWILQTESISLVKRLVLVVVLFCPFAKLYYPHVQLFLEVSDEECFSAASYMSPSQYQ